MFLSFIIPVYNVEQYLAECLDSLLDQDIPREDYEVICVNDGSTDGSLETLRRYEVMYSNIRVIDQPNSGVCVARNVGLRAASGEYIWYIDSDDFIAKNCLCALRQELAQTRSDRLIINHFEYIPGVVTENSSMRINTSWKDSVVWRSIFCREFLLSNDLWFHYPELSFGEDALYMYEVRRPCPSTAEFTAPIYYHRIRPGSLSTETNAATDAKRLRCNIREAQILKGYYERKDGILTEETANRFMSFLCGALFRILMMPNSESCQYISELKGTGLFPYPRPKECTLAKCPEINRNDWLGKIIDLLYINLSSRWGYHGMWLVQRMIRLKQIITR